MAIYNPKLFIESVMERMADSQVPICPYCGGEKFTTLSQYASILINDDLDSVSVGPSVPAGMLVCEKCGHIAFFSLGMLGILPGKGTDENRE